MDIKFVAYEEGSKVLLYISS